jgi:nucleoside phosphorylase
MAPARSADVLILVAHIAELTGLQAVLRPNLRGRVRGLRIAAHAVGVGLSVAGVGAMQALALTRPRAALLLGSCGTYAATPAGARLGLVLPDSVQLVDAATADGSAAYPEPMPVRAKLDRALLAGLARGQRGVLRGALAVTPGITTDDALAARLAAYSGCIAENLEALPVALACAAHGVPFAAVLVNTNDVGARGRAQWLEHHQAAAARGAEAVLDWLNRGAPGVPAR